MGWQKESISKTCGQVHSFDVGNTWFPHVKGLFENHFLSGLYGKKEDYNKLNAKSQLDCILNYAKVHKISLLHVCTDCVKRKKKEAGTSMPQSRSSPSGHGSWGCRRHNWRSWIPQLTDSWSHSAQTLRGSVAIIKVRPRGKLTVCS